MNQQFVEECAKVTPTGVTFLPILVAYVPLFGKGMDIVSWCRPQLENDIASLFGSNCRMRCDWRRRWPGGAARVAVIRVLLSARRSWRRRDSIRIVAVCVVGSTGSAALVRRRRCREAVPAEIGQRVGLSRPRRMQGRARVTTRGPALAKSLLGA
jgi:hypothetical protein